MLIYAGLVCTSASCGHMGVLWCWGGRTDTCTVGVGDVVPPPARPFYVGEEGFAH